MPRSRAEGVSNVPSHSIQLTIPNAARNPDIKLQDQCNSIPNRRRSIVTRPTHLQHVEQGGLSGIVQTEEKKLGVLVEQAKRGEHIVDYNKQRDHISKAEITGPESQAAQGPRHFESSKPGFDLSRST